MAVTKSGRAEIRLKGEAVMNYWLFNAEENPALGGDAADVWFEHNMGFSGDDRAAYGEPLGKMEVGDIVLMYQNNKGFVGIGEVRQGWNGKGYRQKLVYKGCDFDEYRIDIDWRYDFRRTPFEIGYTSPRFLCSIQKPELLKRVEDVIRWASKGHSPRPMSGEADSYVPDDKDERESVPAQIKRRRGAQKFRDALKRQYGASCQVTGCSIFDIVEAAHIQPYRGEKDNKPDNGLLLRADIHTLFDLDLIGVHPDTLAIHCSKCIKHEYGAQVSKFLICSNGNRPSYAALKKRYAKFCDFQ